jgi:DNA repair photolyase
MGLHCGVLVAPVLPGLSDSEAQLTEVVEACAEAGARWIGTAALHLRGPLRQHYLDWLGRTRPDLLGLHRARFGRGAYQSEAERDRVGRIVREAATACGVDGRDRYRPRADPEPDAPGARHAHAAAPAEPREQLRLL